LDFFWSLTDVSEFVKCYGIDSLAKRPKSPLDLQNLILNYCSVEEWTIERRITLLVKNHDCEEAFDGFGLGEKLTVAGWRVLQNQSIFISPGERSHEIYESPISLLYRFKKNEEYFTSRKDVFEFLTV